MIRVDYRERDEPDTYSAETNLIAGSRPFRNMLSNIRGSYWAANRATSHSPGRLWIAPRYRRRDWGRLQSNLEPGSNLVTLVVRSIETVG